MKRQIRINKQASIAYIPKEIVEDGFSENCEAYADAFTLTIVKPGASLGQIRRSLQIVIQDVEMRMEAETAKVE